MADKLFIFCVDTDQYSGIFERQLTAWCTGQVGVCGVGEDEAEALWRDFPAMADALAAIIGEEMDEDGCFRPAQILDTPRLRGVFNTVGMLFVAPPSPEMLLFLTQRARTYEGEFTILGFRLLIRVITEVLAAAYPANWGTSEASDQDAAVSIHADWVAKACHGTSKDMVFDILRDWAGERAAYLPRAGPLRHGDA